MARPILVNVEIESASAENREEADDLLTLCSKYLPSWLTSLVWHLMLLLVLGLISLAGSGFGSGAGTSFEVSAGGSQGVDGNDLTATDDLASASELASSIAPPTDDTLSPAASEITSSPLEELSKIELNGIANDHAAASINPATQGNGKGAGDGVGDSEGSGDDGGGGSGLGLVPVRTQIFGLAAEGTRFVYVFDRSESMNSDFTYTSEGSTVFSVTPLVAAKAELMRSLDDLDRRQRFQIVFYNHQSLVFDPSKASRQLLAATKENKRRAAAFVNRIYGEGGTYHLEPLEVALRMRPDVIFLLTDGEAKDDPPPFRIKQLTHMNGGRTKINVIQFCFTPREGSLLQLAHDNGGQHLFFNISRLGPGLPGSSRGWQSAPRAPVDPVPLP